VLLDGSEEILDGLEGSLLLEGHVGGGCARDGLIAKGEEGVEGSDLVALLPDMRNESVGQRRLRMR
jgi:hypothetical protein